MKMMVNILFTFAVFCCTSFFVSQIQCQDSIGFETFNQNDVNAVINEADIVPKRALILLLHGWLENPTFEYVQRLKNDTLKFRDVNFVIVDWSSVASRNYTDAIERLNVTSIKIAEFIQRLLQRNIVRAGRVHIIGFSLGGQLAGFTGKSFQQIVGGKVGRITGLDPAGPLFENRNASKRLDKRDARFVDVIHTDGLRNNGTALGTLERWGHFDFFPNGGFNQPGCEPADALCNHYRATEFFIESVNPANPDYLSFRCRSFEHFKNGSCTGNPIVEMGINSIRSFKQKLFGGPKNQLRNGRFFLFTNDAPIFAVFHFGVNVRFAPNKLPDSITNFTFQLINGNNEGTVEKTIARDDLRNMRRARFVTYSTTDLKKNLSLKITIETNQSTETIDNLIIRPITVVAFRRNHILFCLGRRRKINRSDANPNVFIAKLRCIKKFGIVNW